jgi:hypothetical protein
MADMEEASNASHWSEDFEQSDVFAGGSILELDAMNFESFFGGFESMTFGHFPIPQISNGSSIATSTSLTLEPRAFEIRQVLQEAAGKLALEYPEDPQIPLILGDINLLTSIEIESCLSSYFANYHRHCPIIHRPSFQPTTAPTTLVLACIALGAMYSEQIKINWMKGLLDVIETYIFSLPCVRDEFLGTMGVFDQPDEDATEYHFQTYQGAYLMVVVQYFSGNIAARRRARRQRFATVLNVSIFRAFSTSN